MADAIPAVHGRVLQVAPARAWFDLPEPVPEAERDERFREVWQLPHAWVHRLKVERPEQLDEDVARWIAGAQALMAKPSAER